MEFKDELSTDFRGFYWSFWMRYQPISGGFIGVSGIYKPISGGFIGVSGRYQPISGGFIGV